MIMILVLVWINPHLLDVILQYHTVHSYHISTVCLIFASICIHTSCVFIK